MRKYFYLVFVLFLFQSCWYTGDDDGPYTSSYKPILQSRADFERSLAFKPTEEVVNAGKIYVKDDFIYINEKGKGFHIYNNDDPKNPKPIGFIMVPLATDLAIRGTTIYVHHAVDLVALNLSVATNSLAVRHRERNVFPKPISPDGYDADFFDVPEDQVILGYELK